MPNTFQHKLLKQRREFLELSRLDVVKRLYELKCDVSEDSIRFWEEGSSSPDADALPALATVLKCKVHEFYA